MHYVAVIDKDPGSAYGVRFPEVPGCYSAADSFDDIVPNAIEALSLFFEDGEPTPPRGPSSAGSNACRRAASLPGCVR